MVFETPDAASLPAGTPVIGGDDRPLGRIHEAYPHYLLVKPADDAHADIEVPVHAIVRFEQGTLYVSVTRASTTVVDDEESAHRRLNDEAR